MLIKRPPKQSPKITLGAQYFLYFGVMGVFLPYFNLYCYHLGFNGFQIGVISALRTGTMVLFPLFWGAIADRFQARRPIYIVCNFLSTAIWIFFLFTTDYFLMLLITIAYGIFYAPIISFLEAFTMDLLGKQRNTYGRIRAWGTINFILIVSVLGKVIDHFSIGIIIILILVGSVLQAIFSIGMPDIKISENDSSINKSSTLLDRRILVFLFCAFLMLASHGAYYGFFSIHLENLGFGSTFIGIAWALASVAEILVMIKSDAIFKRFSLENVLIFSLMVAVLRWIILFYVTSPVAILCSQILHAVTYGTFHMASILFIDQSIPDEAKTFGQSVNNAVTYGLGIMVGFFLSGYFFEHIGSSGLFALSGGIAGIGGLLLWCFKVIDNRTCR